MLIFIIKNLITQIADWESGEYHYRVYQCKELLLGYILVESHENNHFHYVVFPGYPIKLELAATYNISQDGIEEKLIAIAEDAWLHDGVGRKWMEIDNLALAALGNTYPPNNANR